MNPWTVLKYTDCCDLKLKVIDIMCLCSVFSMNPSMPVSHWCCLLKLKQQKYFHCKVASSGCLRKLVDSIRNVQDQKQEGERLNCIILQPRAGLFEARLS